MTDYRDDHVPHVGMAINSGEIFKIHADNLAVVLELALAPAGELQMYVNGEPFERTLRGIIAQIQERYGVATR